MKSRSTVEIFDLIWLGRGGCHRSGAFAVMRQLIADECRTQNGQVRKETVGGVGTRSSSASDTRVVIVPIVTNVARRVTGRIACAPLVLLSYFIVLRSEFCVHQLIITATGWSPGYLRRCFRLQRSDDWRRRCRAVTVCKGGCRCQSRHTSHQCSAVHSVRSS